MWWWMNFCSEYKQQQLYRSDKIWAKQVDELRDQQESVYVITLMMSMILDSQLYEQNDVCWYEMYWCIEFA